MKSEQHGELDEFGTTPRRALKKLKLTKIAKESLLVGSLLLESPPRWVSFAVPRNQNQKLRRVTGPFVELFVCVR